MIQMDLHFLLNVVTKQALFLQKETQNIFGNGYNKKLIYYR